MRALGTMNADGVDARLACRRPCIERSHRITAQVPAGGEQLTRMRIVWRQTYGGQCKRLCVEPSRLRESPPREFAPRCRMHRTQAGGCHQRFLGSRLVVSMGERDPAIHERVAWRLRAAGAV